MAKNAKYHLGIEIDKLTNSIINTISGDRFPTDVHAVAKADLKNAVKKMVSFSIGQVRLS